MSSKNLGQNKLYPASLIINLLVGTRCGGGVFDIIILFGGAPATTLWFSGCPDIIIGGGGGGPLE